MTRLFRLLSESVDELAELLRSAARYKFFGDTRQLADWSTRNPDKFIRVRGQLSMLSWVGSVALGRRSF